MESSQQYANFKPPLPAVDPHLDLYTIPSHSSWFTWDSIHEIERISLKQFFDGASLTRTPKIYRDYRDFIINKFRENPSRRLTFTNVRKSLVGDVSYLRKVFNFLENWGLINFGCETLSVGGGGEEEVEDERWRVKVEEGAPYGVRVVAVPNSLKPVSVPVVEENGRGGGGGGENEFKVAPLASYSDVYGELRKQEKGVVCRNCKEMCNSGHYEYVKEGSFNICVKCFKNGNYGENKSGDDFKFIDSVLNSGNHGAVWTEAETLLLLESVLKHGDDWELVAQNVRTKSKLDCISKLIQLPFGDLMLGSAHGKARVWDSNGNLSGVKQLPLTSSNSQESGKPGDHELSNETQQNGDAEIEGPPTKRLRTAPISDPSRLLMKQVASIATIVGSHATASAAEAAVTALCYENQCPREIFDGDDAAAAGDELGSSPQNNQKERALEVEDSEVEERPTQLATQETSLGKNGKDAIPLTLRMRAASATALGAAAAHAKLLADQEGREIQHLMSTIIETQLKKLQSKIKHFDNLELIMEKEHSQMEELEESLIAERVNVLQRVFNARKPRLGDHTSLKSQTETILN